MTRTIPHRLGLYLAVVQFFFTLTWTVYVIYLPKLAAQVGISSRHVLLILVLDQAIFTVTDFAMGVMADRVARVVGRLSLVILGVTLASCLVFLLLPLAAPQGSAALFFALTLLWTASSSVLRAPPLALFGKHAARPAVPWLSALTLFGLGVAGAIAPYLTVALREADPRLPFALSSIALAAATLGIVWMERALADAAAPAAEVKAAAPKPMPPIFGYLFAVVLLGLGFQVHFAINSARLYLRHAPPADLSYLMPVFWVGFNLLLLPAGVATRRWGGLAVMALGGITGAVATLLALNAGNLASLIALQFIAGGAWGCVLASAVAAALAIGHTGREGKMAGALFALLALVTMARIAVVATGVGKDPTLAAVLGWTPTALWLLAGLLLLSLLPAQRKLMA
jgi:hypothetical protein